MAVDKEQRTRALRYKRPALASMGYEHIQSELEEIVEACDDVACILRQQHYIQLQNEQIQKLREALSLRDEQLGPYENINSEQARQIGLLKEYAALLRQEAGRE